MNKYYKLTVFGYDFYLIEIGFDCYRTIYKIRNGRIGVIKQDKDPSISIESFKNWNPISMTLEEWQIAELLYL